MLLFAGGIALFGLVLGLILDWYIDPRTSTAKKDLVQALGLITAGVAGAVGIYFTWRNLNQSRESTEKTLWLTTQGQISERFTRAIDQLGATDDDGKPKLEIRVGGIYALERIAKDSPKRDSSTVMEVLTAYVRENASSPPKESSTAPKAKEFAVQDIGAKAEDEVYTQQPPPADILAIVDVLRREKDYVPEEYRIRYDLHRTHLYGADLQGAYLYGADLQYAYLYEVILDGADLQYANLHGAILQRANLQEADLHDADLQEADLREADLYGANLLTAILVGARFLRETKGLTQEQLIDSIGDENTELPEGLEIPPSWSQG